MIPLRLALSDTDRAIINKLTAAIGGLQGVVSHMDATVQALTDQVAALTAAVDTDAANKKLAGEEIAAAITEINTLLASTTVSGALPADVVQAIQSATSAIGAATTKIVTPIELPALPPLPA